MAPCSGATDAIPAARAQNCARIPGTPTASSGSSASSPARKHPGAAPASHTALCSPAENCSSAGIAAAPVPVPLLRALPGCFASRSLGNLLFLYTPGPCWSLADLMAPLFDQEPTFPRFPDRLFVNSDPRIPQFSTARRFIAAWRLTSHFGRPSLYGDFVIGPIPRERKIQIPAAIPALGDHHRTPR